MVDCFTLAKVDVCYWQNTKNERFQLGKHHLGKMFPWSVFNSQIKECMVKLVGSISFFFFLLCQENESILKMIYKESVLQFFDVQGVQNY